MSIQRIYLSFVIYLFGLPACYGGQACKEDNHESAKYYYYSGLYDPGNTTDGQTSALRKMLSLIHI